MGSRFMYGIHARVLQSSFLFFLDHMVDGQVRQPAGTMFRAGLQDLEEQIEVLVVARKPVAFASYGERLEVGTEDIYVVG